MDESTFELLKIRDRIRTKNHGFDYRSRGYCRDTKVDDQCTHANFQR